MRIKSRHGGRSKPSAASTPSSMASLSVLDQDVLNAENNTMNDGFLCGQGVLNAEDNTLNEEPRKVTHHVLDKGDCFQIDTCIRCDESGDLLVCNEIGCPIALHEFCMSCQPSFDEEERFYCPYCSYKKVLVRVNELRKKAMMAKRALSGFIDTRMSSVGNSLQIVEAGKKKASNVSTCGVDADLLNHGSHLGKESSGNQDMEVEHNRSNEREDHARTTGDVQAMPIVGVNGEIHDGPIVSNVSNNIHSTPEVQPCEDSMNKEETHEPTSETHQVLSLEDREDGKTMDEEILRLTDGIQDEETMTNQGQPEIPSAHHEGEETAVDDVDHGKEREPQDKGDGVEQIHPEEEGMLEIIDPVSGNNDLKNETVVKKRCFKTKANRRTDLQNLSSPRKSSLIQTPDPGKSSPQMQTPETRKKSPHVQIPEPGKGHATQIVIVSESINLKLQPASPNKLKNLDFHGGKRKRRFWSIAEEEMLKEGVQRFSAKANKNLSWRKILEFGSHVFDNTRTPADLKDKWRNMAK